ncbi:MAG TPA: hypothetical protein VMS78_11590 [Rhizomicrobium sp.]|nr:hypothetical protein [Rhizomicrobium sp.]
MADVFGNLGSEWRRRPLATDILICLFMSLPLFLTAQIPLVDLPNHLAHQYIFRDWSTSVWLQKYYFVTPQVTPNLGLELFVFVARRMMSIDAAVRLFCIITLWLLFWGTKFVSRELNAGSRLYRVVPLLAWGGPFQFGFLNYCFGVGLALLFFGAYLRIRDRKIISLCLLLWPFCLVLLFCHLAAFGLAGLAVAAFELARSYDPAAPKLSSYASEVMRRALRAALIFIPPFLVFSVFDTPGHPSFGLHFATFHQKIEGILSITMFSSPLFEIALLVIALSGLLAALLSGAVRIRPETVTIAVTMAAIYLVLPRAAMGNGFIDYRIPWGASFFVLATLAPDARETLARRLLAVLFGLLSIARVALIAVLWISWEPSLAEIVAGLRSLPMGARLTAVVGDQNSVALSRSPPLAHVAAYAVAYRQAFWSGMFANFPGQLLHFQPGYRMAWFSDLPTKLDRLDARTDFVLVMHPRLIEISKELPLRVVVKGKDYEILAVTRH